MISESFSSTKQSLQAAFEDISEQIKEYCSKNNCVEVNSSAPAIMSTPINDTLIYYSAARTIFFEKAEKAANN